MDVFNCYNNINYLLLRTKPYNPIGRLQTEKESDALKESMGMRMGIKKLLMMF